MNMRPSFQILLLFFFPASFACAQVEAESPPPPRIIFFGDSLTAGYGVDPQQAFPAQVGRLLEEAGVRASIVNAGLSGETTAGGLRRLDWILRQPADILLLGLGANDFLRGLPLEETEANLRAMVAKARAAHPGATVALLGMQAPPNLGSDYAEAFAAIYPHLAKELDLALFPFLLEDGGGHPELNLADGMHPNPEGHGKIAEKLLPFVKALLDSRATASP